MKIIRDDIWVCDDCLFAIENGHTFSIESEERVAEVWKGVRRLGRHLSANWDSETDEGIRDFSWSSCDCCGSRLGGERHRYAVLGPDTKKKTTGTKAKRVASAKTTKSGGGGAWLLDRSKWTLRAVLKSPSQSSVGGGGAAARRAKPLPLVFGPFGPVDYEGGRTARVTLNGVEVGRVMRVANEVHRPGCTYARMFVVTGYKAEVDTRGLRALGVDETSANRAWDACDFDVDHKTLAEAKDALRKGIAAAFNSPQEAPP